MAGATFSVTITEDRFEQLAGQARQIVSAVARKTAFDIQAKAQSLAPVDTGALRNSIQAQEQGEASWTVDVGMSYGMYIEYGTYKMPARPYLTPAVEAAAPAFMAAMTRIFGG